MFKFISLLAALGLCCFARAFSEHSGDGTTLRAVYRPLTAVASLTAAQALGVWASAVAALGLSSGGSGLQSTGSAAAAQGLGCI